MHSGPNCFQVSSAFICWVYFTDARFLLSLLLLLHPKCRWIYEHSQKVIHFSNFSSLSPCIIVVARRIFNSDSWLCYKWNVLITYPRDVHVLYMRVLFLFAGREITAQVLRILFYFCMCRINYRKRTEVSVPSVFGLRSFLLLLLFLGLWALFSAHMAVRFIFFLALI